jgi:hypothetical protein
MGRKRTRKRKRIFLCVAGLILGTVLGCASTEKRTERIRVEVVELRPAEEGKQAKLPPAEKSAQTETSPPEIAQGSAQGLLLRARRLLSQGDYEGSLKESERAFSLAGGKVPGDEALLHIGLVHAHFGNPKRDYAKSLAVLRRLLKEYPQSPWGEEAKVWVAVLQENEKLSEMIEKSKQVDIEVEEKKRKRAK